MAYNTKALKTDVNTKFVPQYYNADEDEYEVVEGEDGAARARVEDGHDVALGAKGDPVAGADLSQEWSLISIEKGILAEERAFNALFDGVTNEDIKAIPNGVAAIEAEAAIQIAAVEAEGSTQVAAVEAAGAEALAALLPPTVGPRLPLAPSSEIAPTASTRMAAFPFGQDGLAYWDGVSEWRTAAGALLLPPIPRTFRNTTTGVCGIYRDESAAGAEAFWMVRPVGVGLYEGWQLLDRSEDTPVPRSIHTLRTQKLLRPVQTQDWDGAHLVRAGTWSSATDAACVFGDRTHSAVAGDTATWTTPANTTVVGARWYRTSNSGMILVSIDGDTTRATLLPTAQDLVDDGDLAATALVANGGTLAPTDRVWNQYGSPSSRDARVLFANDLDAGVHTVVMTVTGYEDEDPANVGSRLYLTGLLYQTTATTIATSNVLMYEVEDLGPAVSSVYEYAMKPTPSGEAFGDVWLGNTHGNDEQVSVAAEVDGVVVDSSSSPYPGFYHTIVTGSEPVITRVSTLVWPGPPETAVATATVYYMLHREWGLVLYRVFDWLVDVDARTCFVAMYPASNRFTVGSNSAGSTDDSLTADAGASVANAQGNVVYMWEGAGTIGVYHYCVDLTEAVADFAFNPSSYHYIEDRTTGDMNKIYLLRGAGSGAAPAEPVTAGTRWRVATWLGCKVFADADAALAR